MPASLLQECRRFHPPYPSTVTHWRQHCHSRLMPSYAASKQHGSWTLLEETEAPVRWKFAVPYDKEVKGYQIIETGYHSPSTLSKHNLIFVLPRTIVTMKIDVQTEVFKKEMQIRNDSISTLADQMCLVSNEIDLPRKSLTAHTKDTALPWHQKVNWALWQDSLLAVWALGIFHCQLYSCVYRSVCCFSDLSSIGQSWAWQWQHMESTASRPQKNYHF